jgi:DNA-binding MarR family transcriptional regulator
MRGQFVDGDIVLPRALAYWANRFTEVARRAMYRAFREHEVEITPEQWMVLVTLWQRGPSSQRAIAERVDRDAPTMSRIIDSMSRAGLVERRPDSADGRSVQIALTRRAKDLKPILVPVVEKLVADLEAGVPAADLEVTRRTLMRLVENLSPKERDHA